MNIVFKDDFDDIFILKLLLGVYVVLYDGFNNGCILGPLFGYVVWLNHRIKYGTILVLLLWSEYEIKDGFLNGMFLGYDVGPEDGF